MLLGLSSRLRLRNDIRYPDEVVRRQFRFPDERHSGFG